MNDRLVRVKAKLLELGYIDNEYLDKYLELLEQNLTTPKNSRSTQAHHVIPTRDFKENSTHYKDRGNGYCWQMTVNKAELDKDNFRINLLYKDHLRAHNLLALCRDLDEIQRNYEATYEKIAIRKAASKGTKNVKMPKYITEEQILKKIAHFTKLADEAIDETTAHKYRSSLSQWRSKYTQFLANPEKYSISNKPAKQPRTINEQYHLIASKKRELKSSIDITHKNYTEAILQHTKDSLEAKEARLLWKQAIAEYNNFCKETCKNTP